MKIPYSLDPHGAWSGFAPMTDRALADVREHLRRAGEARCFSAALADDARKRPLKPCPGPCRGRGAYDRPDGTFCGSCATCRGFGKVPMTDDDVREAYAATRSAVRDATGMTAREVDAAVRRTLPRGATGAEWLDGVRQLYKRTMGGRS